MIRSVRPEGSVGPLNRPSRSGLYHRIAEGAMGNFYTNIVVRGSKAPTAIAALRDRKAFVAVVEDTTFVYDERCDSQNVDEIRKLARHLSKECRAPALAALNHDDDVLWLALARDGTIVDVYESNPGFERGSSEPPAIANLDALCEAFDASQVKGDIEALLRGTDFTFEVQRHQQLLDLLGIDGSAGTMGFNYVWEGELQEALPDIELHEVG